MKDSQRGLISGEDLKEEISKIKKEEWLRSRSNHFKCKMRSQSCGLPGNSLSILLGRGSEIKLEWGKGLAQKQEAEAREQELELEKAKPFARTRDDLDLNNMQKDTVRWGDPMAHLVKKKHSEVVLPDIRDNAAPNRYGIKPGRHWDGVDRSNGFEDQMFNRENEKQATEREGFMWSVADM
ncbi:hypothetical protein L1987_85942 [Smallanthus sonchifolius]|uniref:Uncharacterized protein n=1 Tax=Smallanthus sonchifolius TaxID=185202 RepID=A0ACB8XY48_9ASTR|nr:hypothetical protein L1987_85942 [Smallanthus sonchifolius]